jgi:putative endonuclease
VRDTRVKLGRRGEELAVAELTRRGYEITARNWRCQAGEVDVVARQVQRSQPPSRGRVRQDEADQRSQPPSRGRVRQDEADQRSQPPSRGRVRQDEVWTFFEVRTRRGQEFGTPEESLTPAKQRRMVDVALTYLAEHDLNDVDWRLGLVAVEMDQTGHLLRIDVYDSIT